MAKKTQPGTGKPRNTADIGFEKQIWDAACVLWGHIPASEYRNVIIGLIFLKYISTAFEKKYNQLVLEGDGFENDPDAYLEENVFFCTGSCPLVKNRFRRPQTGNRYRHRRRHEGYRSRQQKT